MPPTDPTKPGTGQYYARVSSTDPYAGSPPSPPSKFDFMMQNQPKPPGRFSGQFAWMPKPAKIALLVLGLIFILVILYSLFFGGKATNTDRLTAAMARAQETARVSALVQQQSKNTDTKDLATTVEMSLNSQKQELIKYLGEQKVKVDAKKLAAGLNKTTDSNLEKAQQNNSYDQTYFNYLKSSLASYQTELEMVYRSAGPKLKTTLSADFDSLKTILAAPQLK